MSTILCAFVREAQGLFSFLCFSYLFLFLFLFLLFLLLSFPFLNGLEILGKSRIRTVPIAVSVRGIKG